MSVPLYLATLKRFGLEELTHGDLVLKDGNITKTTDGNLQFGDSRINALFRFVEEWRLNQSTLDGLFESMLETSQRLEELRKTRQQWFGTWLVNDPAKLHKENESIRNHETGSSVFAGAILVVLNNLLRRCQEDLGADDVRWKAAGLTTVIQSAAWYPPPLKISGITRSGHENRSQTSKKRNLWQCSAQYLDSL